MENTRCCVCHEPFADDALRWLGGRPFCAEHHTRALDATRTHWSRAGLVESALVALFVLGVALAFGNHPLPTSLDVGLGLALVPAILWMVFIYRQDRVEPEPLGLVVGVFVLGGLLATAVQGPVLDVFGIDRWHHRDALAPWIASIAVEGTIAMLCAYVAVRYSVFFTSELDEPVDGVIYATAASLGVATAVNVDLVMHHQGVLPLAGATTMASTTLEGRGAVELQAHDPPGAIVSVLVPNAADEPVAYTVGVETDASAVVAAAPSGTIDFTRPTTSTPTPTPAATPPSPFDDAQPAPTATGFAIRGALVDGTGGRPVSGAWIFVGRPDADLQGALTAFLQGRISEQQLDAVLVGVTRSDVRGLHAMRGLPEGRFPFALVAEGYRPQFLTLTLVDPSQPDVDLGPVRLAR